MDQAREYKVKTGMLSACTLSRSLLQPLGSMYLQVDRSALVQRSMQTIRSSKLQRCIVYSLTFVLHNLHHSERLLHAGYADAQ